MLSREGPQRCALGSKQPHLGVKDWGAEQGDTSDPGVTAEGRGREIN